MAWTESRIQYIIRYIAFPIPSSRYILLSFAEVRFQTNVLTNLHRPCYPVVPHILIINRLQAASKERKKSGRAKNKQQRKLGRGRPLSSQVFAWPFLESSLFFLRAGRTTKQNEATRSLDNQGCILSNIVAACC